MIINEFLFNLKIEICESELLLAITLDWRVHSSLDCGSIDH